MTSLRRAFEEAQIRLNDAEFDLGLYDEDKPEGANARARYAVAKKEVDDLEALVNRHNETIPSKGSQL